MRTKASLVTPEDTLPLRPLHALCCWYGSVHHGPSYGQLSGVRSLCRDAVNIYLQCHFVRLIHGTLYMFHRTRAFNIVQQQSVESVPLWERQWTWYTRYWYRRVSQTWCTAGTGGCQLQARRNAVRHPTEPPYTPWKPENTKWIKRRFNEYWNIYLSRWLQRRGRPGCRPNLILRCSILRKDVLEKQKHHLLRRKRRKQGFIVMQM